MSAFDFLDLSQWSTASVVYLALGLTVGFTIISLGIAWLWRRYRG